MLFGRKNNVIAFSLFSIAFIIFVLIDKNRMYFTESEEKKSKMQQYTQKNIIKFSREQFMDQVGDIYPDVQSYFNEDRRLIAADKAIGFSKVFLEKRESKQNIVFNGYVEDLLPIEGGGWNLL